MRQSSKLSIWSGLTLLALCGAQSSRAADFSAPTYQDPPAFSWSGAYVGAHGGLGFTGSPNPFADRNGVALGVQAGYNMQAGPGIVGAEIEGSYLGDTEHKVNGGKLKEKWRGAIKAKAGLTFDQTLVYGTAGYAMTSYKKGGDVRNDVGFKGGYLLGAGVEQAFAGGLSAKLEYNYITTPDVRTYTSSGSSEKDINSHVIKAGINMRF
ncbi:porin family protein (plasmid) [Ensifer sp. PDNC004]|uniref:outer membrane protein n=1 Tax=Ensifer sp. PDNC004 TaxID=2811423 RepID=UPI0019646FE0|nr:outer membrane protein [Ensifer sp. PDNC004]QRY65202.1 porin family protein [Ensifer sp. PDNC004]